MKYTSFIIQGQPTGKGRPRFSRYGTYTPLKTKEYENKVVECFLKENTIKGIELYSGAIKIVIWAVFEPVKSISKKKRELLIRKAHMIKPDIDNIVKIITDGLNGVAYKDDSQVCELEAHKIYGNCGRVEVQIVYLED